MNQNEKILAEIKLHGYFDRHVVKKVRPHVWFCHIPGKGDIYSFYVTTPPGALICYGDIGELVFLPGGGEILKWGVKNFDPGYPYYPLTKLSPSTRERQFQPGAATSFLKERVEEAGTSSVLDEEDLKRAKGMLEEWEERCGNEPYEDETEWWNLWARFGDPDAPSMRDFARRVYWVFHALCWFFSQVDKDDDMFKEEWNGT